jgi:O-antigen/teichoic acid export membrane protein
MSENQSSYRQIIKATSIFGGVQVFKIFISIIRSKFVAVLLGPVGMGIVGLLSSTIGLISGLTNFGLGISAVKDIAAANQSQDIERISTITAVFRRLVWITGLLGAITTLMLSPWLSELTFGNKNYTFSFMWLSITLLFNQLSSGQNVLMQGMRKLQYLAKANMYGAILGLFISLPLYFFYGVDGIVPAIILSSLFALLLSWFFAKKILIKNPKITYSITLKEGKGMLSMGIMLSLSNLIATGSSYVVRIFISNQGGIEDVGLFNAGFAILFSYVGLIFAAMATDYYPRLSGVSDNNEKVTLLVNQQAEIGILILAPILSVFLIFINWIILILYSNKFVGINEMIHWATLGMYFKVASWSIAFILLAKGNSKLFFWNELIVSIYTLVFNLIGYYWMGLTGLGISFLFSYFLYLIQVYILTKYKYDFCFNRSFYKIAFIQFSIGLICFIIIKYITLPYAYFYGLPVIIISIWYSFKELDKRIDIKNIFKK